MTSRIESILAAIVAVAILALATWWHLGQVKKAERAVHAHYSSKLGVGQRFCADAGRARWARHTRKATSRVQSGADAMSRLQIHKPPAEVAFFMETR